MRKLLLLVVFSLGCGGGSADTLRDFCDDAAAAACDRMAECFDGVPQGECREAFTDGCCDGDDCDDELSKAQRHDAAECVDALQEATCTENSIAIPAECE